MLNKFTPKQLDNFHILMWLLKDIFWVREMATLATLMIIPTVGVAFILTLQSFKYKKGFLSNFAILCWMVADSVWMLDEFYLLDINWITTLFFSLGIFSMGYYYLFVVDIFKVREMYNKPSK